VPKAFGPEVPERAPELPGNVASRSSVDYLMGGVMMQTCLQECARSVRDFAPLCALFVRPFDSRVKHKESRTARNCLD
jgi:hypothetical protein